MAKRRKVIITKSREIYEKFNMLHFSPEVVLRNDKKIQVDRIIRNINKKAKVLDCELVGDYIIIRRLNPVNFTIYLK